MVRVLITAALLAVCISQAAGNDLWVFEVDKPLSESFLYSSGVLFLEDVGTAMIVMGDSGSAARMGDAGLRFRRVLPVHPGQDVFILKRPDVALETFSGEEAGSVALACIGDETYLTAVYPEEIARLDKLLWEKARLVPGGYPGLSHVNPLPPLGDPLPAGYIEGLVSRVSGDSLWKCISELSGRDAIVVGSTLDTLHTRYSFSEGIDVAAEYLRAGLESHGVIVEYDPYVVGEVAFYSGSFPDASSGWVVGNDGAVYATGDGGLSWQRREVDPANRFIWGVCFVGGGRGWVCGAGGTVYHTADGGATWLEQVTPTRVNLRDICFVDSLEGWVVGDGGEILHTEDGGVSWSKAAGQTRADLYAVDFWSSERGWVCGVGGTILSWDGLSWTLQPTGTGVHLMDIDFGSDRSGWAVGRGATVLRTENGGLEWETQIVPQGTSPFLNGVASVGVGEGWVVGLNGTLLRTLDGGGTWAQQASGTLFGLNRVGFVDSLTGWIVGFGSSVLHSGDGGATWFSMRENLPPEAIVRLKNVVGTLPGTESEAQVIVCGHFDSISEDPLRCAPGADDNASGTAAVMEAARVLSEAKFERTIKFICFSGEEQGLFGSGEYIADPRYSCDEIAGVLNFDMIGFADTVPEDIDIIANTASGWLADLAADCSRDYVPSLGVKKIIDPTMVYSDHASFWKAGRHAVLCIEDIDIPYPHYHTTGDTLGNLDKDFTADVVRLGIAMAACLARPDTTASDPEAWSGIRTGPSFPNPFLVETAVRFSVGGSGEVEVTVLDVRGRQVRNLMRKRLSAGGYMVAWDGCGENGLRVPPGIYFVRVRLGDASDASKTVLLR